MKLGLALGAFIPLQRWLHRHLQGLLYLLTRRRSWALLLYALLLLPGVAVHEASHWLTARLLRVRTRGLSLLPRRRRGGMVQLGSVQTVQVDPLRASLIGLAPLVAGGILMGLLAFNQLGLDLLMGRLAGGDLGAAAGDLQRVLATRDLLLWLYLVFAISNTMLPSRADRGAWLSALAILGLLLVAGAAVGLVDPMALRLGPLTARIVDGLGGIFLIAAGLDLLLLIPLLLLELVLTRLVGWEIVY